MSKILVSPSILNVEKDKLFEVSNQLQNCGADWLHCDVMDGVFVPNVALGLEHIRNLHQSVNLPLDVHLMVTSPLAVVEDYVKAGASIITIHSNTDSDVAKTAQRIRKFGAKVGIAVNPEVAVEDLLPYADLIDMVLIMSVKPGFGGQKFMPSCIEKIKTARKLFPNKLIQVDGGINAETAKLVVDAGANVLVAGSFIVFAENKAEAISKLKNL